MLYDALIGPFLEFEFMRRALVSTFALAFGAAPIGVILMLRRMSLIGDAMSHAILPGAAIGFMLAGLNLFAMAAGGLIAGFIIAVGAGLIARSTQLKEDASLAAFFLISLALGVTLVSVKGNNIDLLHFLFGSVLAVDDPALLLVVGIASVSLVVLALIWSMTRPPGDEDPPAPTPSATSPRPTGATGRAGGGGPTPSPPGTTTPTPTPAPTAPHGSPPPAGSASTPG